jgi:uncharacterized protein (TIGR03086 family)
METRKLYELASDQFGRKVAAINDEQWGDSTPCTEWNVRALVNHLTSEIAWIPPLLAQKTIAEIGDSLDGDLLGDDPKASWARRADEAQAAVAEDGALDRTVHISRGDVPGAEYVFEVVADLAVHGWDLARAIGADETIDPDLLDVIEPYYGPLVEMYKAYGAFGPELEAPPDANRQTKLLALLGRQAW